MNNAIHEEAKRWGIQSGDILSLKGNLYISANGILKIAHQSGKLSGIKQDLSQQGNLWICKCTVLLKDGSAFEEYGDSEGIKAGLPPVRMTVTRARSRALKIAFAIPYEVADDLEENPTPVLPSERSYKVETTYPRRKSDPLSSSLDAPAPTPSPATFNAPATPAPATATAAPATALAPTPSPATPNAPAPATSEPMLWQPPRGRQTPPPASEIEVLIWHEDCEVTQERTRVMRGLHAAAAQHGLKHEDLHFFLGTSLKRISQRGLEKARDLLNCSDLADLAAFWKTLEQGERKLLELLKDHAKRRMEFTLSPPKA